MAHALTRKTMFTYIKYTTQTATFIYMFIKTYIHTYIDVHISHVYTQLHSGSVNENPAKGIRCRGTGETNLSKSPSRGGEHSTMEDLDSMSV